ncbi:hypothetical protein BJ508DRAFT_331113 [Ascobolus immersus RN42]|uniref:Uncharacterized protein n=1 Tax=Ascobolus immersus RN42 TaxID=1160509 RepID=A0A3N4HX71_ASCIM|nr:hypothetical protein BJ508DRAFT_331113 [Ascobolus immersus RN42]
MDPYPKCRRDTSILTLASSATSRLTDTFPFLPHLILLTLELTLLHYTTIYTISSSTLFFPLVPSLMIRLNQRLIKPLLFPSMDTSMLTWWKLRSRSSALIDLIIVCTGWAIYSHLVSSYGIHEPEIKGLFGAWARLVLGGIEATGLVVRQLVVLLVFGYLMVGIWEYEERLWDEADLKLAKKIRESDSDLWWVGWMVLEWGVYYWWWWSWVNMYKAGDACRFGDYWKGRC